MIKSEMAVNAQASVETNEFVLNSLGLEEHDGHIQYMVIKSKFSQEEIYCAIAGGQVTDTDINLTPIGTGAYEALSSIPGDDIEMYELSADDDVMAEQIPNIISQHKTGSRICFVSDNLVEREEQILTAFALENAA